MSNADKIMLECTSCGRKKRVPREPTDAPGLALLQIVCDRCDQGNYSPQIYFDAQGHQIDCDGELLEPSLLRRDTVLIAISVIAAGLLIYEIAR